MKDKRFHIINGVDNLAKYGIFCKPVLEDGETGEQYILALDLMDLLNHLHEEKEDMATKKEDAEYELFHIKEENEQLKQFKEDVFNKIDMHLRMLPTTRDNEFNEEDGDPSLYTGAIYMLETLKKELEE